MNHTLTGCVFASFHIFTGFILLGLALLIGEATSGSELNYAHMLDNDLDQLIW